MAVYTVVMASYGIAEGMSVALILATMTAAIALVCGQFLRKLDESIIAN
jgi:hypothetical protein